MAYPFSLSTTSTLTFQPHFTSSTHPSLPVAASSRRSIARSQLKAHKRLSQADQSNNYSNLVSVVNDYLKILLTLDHSLSNRAVAGEHIDIALVRDIEVEWRPTLSSSPVPTREADRVKGQGLDYEIYNVLQTLGTLHSLVARQGLLSLYSSTTPSVDHRTSLIQSSTKALQQAHGLHTYLVQRSTIASDGLPTFPPAAVDISVPVQVALQHLTHAQINLLSVLKDDPYPALLIQSRNKDDKEWMIKPPTIAKVRAQVLTRLCIGAAEHASSALATLQSSSSQRLSKSLISFTTDLRATCRAKTCRFQCLSHDDSGQTGVAIAWLHAGLHELGVSIATDSKTSSSLSRLKQSFSDKRDDKKLSSIATSTKSQGEWGLDGGRAEEIRILYFLLERMNRMNDSFNVQVVPDWRPLVGQLPGGMNMPVGGDVLKGLVLGEEELAEMRAPVEREDYAGGGESSEDEEDDRRTVVPGAFEQGSEPTARAYY